MVGGLSPVDEHADRNAAASEAANIAMGRRISPCLCAQDFITHHSHAARQLFRRSVLGAPAPAMEADCAVIVEPRNRTTLQLIWTRAPPSTGSATPVMKFASSEARNNAALATSQAVPILCRNGTRASRDAATSARLLPEARARVSTAIGVSIRPGRITLARTPNSAFWIASCWVKAIIPALVAL